NVTGKAIAIWGFAGAAGVAPFSLDLTACPILAQPTPPLDTTCQFLYDDNGAQARWGGMNLDTWGTISNVNQSCDHSVTPGQYAGWEAGPSTKSMDFPLYVCADTGFGGNAVWGNLANYVNHILYFPLVAKNGNSLYFGNNPSFKFQVTGVIPLKLVAVRTGKGQPCNGVVFQNSSSACLVLQWVGPQTGGVDPGTSCPGTGVTTDTCLRAIRLVG